MIEIMTHWSSESMIQSTDDSGNHWTNEAAKQWMSELLVVSRCTNEGMNQWINEQVMKQWVSESMNELVNWWINESVNERPNGWWMDGWMSYVFVCLPASSSVAPILLLAQLLQLQCVWKPPPPLRIARAPQHHSSLARSQPNAFCQKRLETRIAGASRQIDQRWCSADNGGDSALLWTPIFFLRFLFLVKSSSCYSLEQI